MEKRHNRQFRPSALCLAIGLIMSGHCFAQENASDERVVVWGTHVSSNTESMVSDDISLKQADHMSDLLREIPGVDVGGTHSVNQRITIRGLGETDLDIRLDGASQHANMFHHVGNLTLNPDILKAAEIQVGNNSVAQNGLGGSVYFETKDARDLLRYDESFGVRVYGGYASNDSQQRSATLYGLLGEPLDYMLYANYVTRDDFKDGNGDTTFGSAGDVYNILGKLGYEISNLHRLELSYDLYRDEGDYSPRPDMSGGANQGLSQDKLIPTEYNRDTVTLGYELRGDKHQGKVTLYTTKTKITRDESVMAGQWQPNRVGKNSAENQNDGVNAKFVSNFDLAERRNALTYGFDYMDKTSSSTYVGKQFMKESAKSFALFVEDQVWLTERFSITAGLRSDDYKREATTGTHKFDDVTWALATEWQASDAWSVFASTRSLFKGPELMETFVAFQDVAYLADDIKAETGQNTQGGVKFNQRVDKHAFGANLTLFKTDIDDYIAEAYDKATESYLYYNMADVEIKGFEAAVSYGYDAFNGKLSYAKSDIKNKQTGGVVLAPNLRSMDVGDSIALNLDYYAASWDVLLGWSSMFVLEEDNVSAGAPVKEGYNTHNLYAQWIPQKVDGLTVTFGIDNLFDETYTSHASRSGVARGFTLDDYEPGRNIKLSAAYQF